MELHPSKGDCHLSLKNLSTKDLADELATREDLLDPSGIMPLGIYQILMKVAVIPCTDGVAVRRNKNGIVEAMAIRRGTGVFKGRLCSVGGRILRGESIENCLRRQFRNDVGCEIKLLVPWKRPSDIGQAYPLENPLTDVWPSDFGPEDHKHTTSNYYPVQLIDEPKFGSTSYGSQETTRVEWYTLEDLPDPENFGYDQHPKFVACLKAAEKLI